MPDLIRQADELPNSNDFDVILSEDAEKIQFYYLSVVAGPVNCLRDHVLLEFGVRNSTEPCVEHHITPYLLQENTSFSFPAPHVNTLC